MSGHSKWSTIKRKKGALDAKRSKIFTKIVKEIMVSVKVGGNADPEANPRLRLAIQSGKAVNLPKDNIQRAIQKAEGGSSLEEYTFEGYGPCGVAVFIECLTDNTNRTISNVRLIFTKHGGNLGNMGSLGFLFNREGVFEIKKDEIRMPMDDFELGIIDAGVKDVSIEDDFVELTCAMDDFGKVQKKLDELKIEISKAELQRIPNDTKRLDVADALRVMKFIDTLEDDDDVSQVYHNLEMTDQIAEALNQ